jgi:glycosyltransferase involved in cell wall biosynthesis
MNIVMLLSNPFRPDPRVLKEASSLTKNGYKVSILCWDRRSEFPPEEVYEGITLRRIAIPSNYASGPQQVLHIPRFWYQALKIANDLKPDILHCHDLDTTPIGYLYSRRKNIPWIYDAHECYPEQMRQQAGRLLYQLLLRLDNFMAKRAGKMITINELLASHFRTLGGR